MFDNYPHLELLAAIVHASLLAIGLIAPLGIQNIFIFNQGASHKYLRHALPSVITASLCDTLLILLAVCGISIIVMQITWLKFTLYIGGFFFLVYMAWHCWKNASVNDNIDTPSRGFSTRKQIMFAATTSLLNPHAYIDTIAVIGTSSLEYEEFQKIVFTATCIIVSWLWFLGLALCGNQLHKLPNKNLWIYRVNRMAAIIMWVIAFYLAMQIIDDLTNLLNS